jgi:hypothetical protein
MGVVGRKNGSGGERAGDLRWVVDVCSGRMDCVDLWKWE